jgi:ABC-2 type transport system permease protein
MSLLFTIAGHELKRSFASPLAWACLAVVQLITGIVFWLLLAEFSNTASNVGVAEFVGGGLFGFSTVVLLLVIPLLTMRSFADERQNGSLELLLASPASLTAIVLGKYLGLLGFLAIMLGMIAAMPLSLMIGTPLDLGLLLSGILGLGLMMAAFAAAGLFISAWSRQPIVAAIGSFGLLLVLWLLQVAGSASGPVASIAEYISILGHFDQLRRGIFDSSDVAYYVLFCASFLGLSVQRFALERQA